MSTWGSQVFQIFTTDLGVIPRFKAKFLRIWDCLGTDAWLKSLVPTSTVASPGTSYGFQTERYMQVYSLMKGCCHGYISIDISNWHFLAKFSSIKCIIFILFWFYSVYNTKPYPSKVYIMVCKDQGDQQLGKLGRLLGIYECPRKKSVFSV